MHVCVCVRKSLRLCGCKLFVVMGDTSPQLPGPAPWKKDLRLLRKKKHREIDTTVRSIDLDLNHGHNSRRIQTPVQRYGNESFEKNVESGSTPHFDAGSYSTPPRNRSPRRRKDIHDAKDEGVEEAMSDLSKSVLGRSQSSDPMFTSGYRDPKGGSKYEDDGGSDVEIGSGLNDTPEHKHPFNVAVSPLPVKASVDVSRTCDMDTSLLDDANIMEEAERWHVGDMGQHIERQDQCTTMPIRDGDCAPTERPARMSANGPTPGAKVFDVLSEEKANVTKKQSIIKRVLGSLQKKKKVVNAPASLPGISSSKALTASSAFASDESPIRSSHYQRAARMELAEREEDQKSVVRRRKTRIKDAIHEDMEMDVHNISGEDSSQPMMDGNVVEKGVSDDDEEVDTSKPMWRSDIRDSDQSVDDSGEEELICLGEKSLLTREEPDAGKTCASKIEGEVETILLDRDDTPTEFKAARSKEGKIYFYNRTTRQTQWQYPHDGIVVNLDDFPELRWTPETSTKRRILRVPVHEKTTVNGQMPAEGGNNPVRKLHFSGMKAEESIASFDGESFRASSATVVQGRIFAITQAAVVLLSASPNVVGVLYCPYCGTNCGRQDLIGHLHTCDVLSHYINASPSHSIIVTANDEEQDQDPMAQIKFGEQICTPSRDSRPRPNTTPGYRTPIHTPATFDGDALSEDGSPSDVTLYPCEHCGRTFAHSRLEVHERVCQRIFGEKRHQYDAAQARTKGTPYRTGSSAQSVPQPPHLRRGNRGDDLHDDHVGNDICTPPSQSSAIRSRPATTGQKKQCPFCKVSTAHLSSHLLKCKRQKQSRKKVWGEAKDSWEHRSFGSAMRQPRARNYLAQTPSVSELPL